MAASPSTALRSPGVWIGFFGMVALGWGTCHPEFSFSLDGWPSAVVDAVGRAAVLPLDRVLIVAGATALTWGWWHIRPTGDRQPVNAPVTLALWSLPLLLVPPVLSPDAVLYADLGWTLHTGANPYLVGVATSGGPYAAQVDPLWAGSGVAYPPLALLIAQAMVTIVGFHPYVGILAMRLPALIATAVMLALVPRIAGLVALHKRTAVWLAVLNPLLVLHFIGAGHNDAPMVAASLAAVWASLRWHRPWATLLAAPVLVGVAMALKPQGGLTVLAVAGAPIAAQLAAARPARRLWLLGVRTVVVTAVAVLAFVAISLASGLGFGWASWLDLMGLAATPAPLALLAKLVALSVQTLGGSYTGVLIWAGRVTTLILLGVLAWIIVRFSDRPLAATAWGSLAIAVLGQAMHPWYLPWSLALLAVVPLTVRQRYAVYGLAIAFCMWNALQTVIWHGQY